jgi:O-antigen ligase
VAARAVSTPDAQTPSGAALALGAFALTVADIPRLSTSVWAPKFAVLLVLGAAGFPFLVMRAIDRRGEPKSDVWAARFALGFLAVGVVSVVRAAKPVFAIVGPYQQGTGWLFLAALAGFWALGTGRGAADRRLLESALIAGAGANAVVAILQQLFDLDRIGLGAYRNSAGTALPDGLLGNPVFSGALLAGAFVLLAPRFRDRPWRWSVLVAAVGFGLGVGSERLPALLSVLVCGWVLWDAWRRRGATRRGAPRTSRRTTGGASKGETAGPDPGVTGGGPERRSGGVVVALAFGALAIGGIVAGSWAAHGRGGLGVVSHAAQSTQSETYGQRLHAWSAALHAIAHQPLFGYGPGQFRAATSPYFTAAFARGAPGVSFTDAHNLAIEYATTTGVVGAALLLSWLGFASWNRRGPLAGFALVVLVMELAEPLNVALTPIAFMALGAAVPAKGGEDVPAGGRDPTLMRRRVGLAAAILAVVAVLPASAVVVGDLALARGQAKFEVAQDAGALRDANDAEILLAPWAEAPSLLARTHLYLAVAGAPSETSRAVRWARVAAGRDPTNPGPATTLASYQLYAKDLAGARSSARRVLAAAPWYAPAMTVLGRIAFASGDDARGRYWYRRSLAIDPNQPALRKALAAGRGPR